MYPLFLKQIKKIIPSLWEPSKLVHVNCMKHFKMKELHFMLQGFQQVLWTWVGA